MPTLPRNKHIFIQFFPHRTRLFHLSTEEVRFKSKKKDIKVLIPASTKETIVQNTRSKGFLLKKVEKFMKIEKNNNRNT